MKTTTNGTVWPAALRSDLPPGRRAESQVRVPPTLPVDIVGTKAASFHDATAGVYLHSFSVSARGARAISLLQRLVMGDTSSHLPSAGDGVDTDC
jgi:hypothetical protein